MKGVLDFLADEVTVEWTLDSDASERPVVVLKMSDDSGSVSDRFTPEELGNTERLEFRLSRRWQELLQIGSREGITRIRELLKQLREE